MNLCVVRDVLSAVDDTVNRRDEFAAVEVHCAAEHWTFLLHGFTLVLMYCNLQLGKRSLHYMWSTTE